MTVIASKPVITPRTGRKVNSQSLSWTFAAFFQSKLPRHRDTHGRQACFVQRKNLEDWYTSGSLPCTQRSTQNRWNRTASWVAARHNFCPSWAARERRAGRGQRGREREMNNKQPKYIMQERRLDSYDWLLVQNASLQVSLFPEFCRHHQRHLGRSNIISFRQCFQQKYEFSISILKIPWKKIVHFTHFTHLIYWLIFTKKKWSQPFVMSIMVQICLLK